MAITSPEAALPKDLSLYFDNLCDREKPLIWFATISKDGRPHVVPTCFVQSLNNGKIAVGGVLIRQTIKNVMSNRYVALGSTKMTETGYRGYMIKGSATVLQTGAEFEKLKDTIYQSTKGRRTINWMILVSPDRVYSLEPRDGAKRVA